MMPNLMETVYERASETISREVAGQFVLVPIRQAAADMSSILTLNSVGWFIWQRIDGRTSLRDIRDAVVKEFDVAPETAEADIAEYIAQLEGHGQVRVRHPEEGRS